VTSGHHLVVSWLLTVIFVLLLVPCVQRLSRPDPPATVPRRRDSDLAELLLTLAMVAMFSPVGGPIPAAGWQAVLLLVAAYFLGMFLHDRGAPGAPGTAGHTSHDHLAHHAVCAALMLYMITAMPHAGVTHGPWFTMSGMDPSGSLALPALATVGAVGLAVDATHCGTRVVRRSPGTAWHAKPETYRATMGLGMAYMLITAV
jgi:hypothetical protein